MGIESFCHMKNRKDFRLCGFFLSVKKTGGYESKNYLKTKSSQEYCIPPDEQEHGGKEAKMAKRIFVGNLSYKVTEETLKEAFAKIGEVQSVKIITDSATGRSKGFGFVEMSSDADAEKAISSLHGTMLLDRSITVNEARPQTSRGRTDSKRGQGGFNMRGRKSGNWR